MNHNSLFKKTKIFLTATALVSLAISGCAKTEKTYVTNPNPNELKPTGTVQGLLRDKVTQQPIVGAIVDIDGITATTNDNGQFSLHNVPTTQGIVTGGTTNTTEIYKVTFNLKNVTSPVKMVNKVTTTNCGTVAAPTACYPEFAYETVAVKYETLNDTTNDSTSAGGATNASNHDTPVTGLSATMDVSVGKLAAKITGVVGYQRTKLSVNEAGWTVKLIATSSGSNNAAAPATDPDVDAGTGGASNVVGVTTTDASGAFTFDNIESLRKFDIVASNSAGTYRGTEVVTAPADGQTKSLSLTGDPTDAGATETTDDLGTVLVEVATSTITGEVAYSTNSQPVPADWAVKLYTIAVPAVVVGSTTTDANGKFTFANVAANTTFTIDVASPDGKFADDNLLTALPTGGATSPAFGETKSYTVQGKNAVLVVSTDTLAPSVISVSPENNSDKSPTGGINVVFTFSEPIKADVYATTLSNHDVFTNGTNGLWDDVAVNYDGPKAGNIAHTLAWSTDRKALTVNIPTLAPASTYTVDISTAVTNLLDDSNTAIAPIAVPFTAVSSYRKTTFTTNGAASAAAPAITLVNATSLNSTGLPILDWNPVSGAKEYNVYRGKSQVWGTTTNNDPYLLDACQASTSNFADGLTRAVGADTVLCTADDTLTALPFVENSQVKLTYSYIVRSVNADGTESVDSNVVTAEDKVGVSLDTASATFIGQINDGNTTITISFNEPLDEASAETVANYTLSGIAGTVPTITSATYDITTNDVTLTLSGSLTAANITRTYISPGTDGIIQSATVAGDTALMPVGTKLGQQCVSPAGTGDTTGAILSTPVHAADVSFLSGDSVYAANSIYAGADGVCNSAAVAGDTSVTATAGTIGVTAATYTAGVINNAAGDFTLGSTVLASSDDAIVRTVLVTVSNVTDVALNTILSTANQHDTDGTLE